MTRATLDLLTRRELEIALLVSAGRRNAEIAVQLGITVNTVKNHLQRICKKLGVGSRMQVMLWVLANERAAAA